MRIAVIGSGISGMVAAHLLSEDHEVVVHEANDYIGGHTHTVDVHLNGDRYAIDTGFIVFNEQTYPNFIKLMNRLGVGWQLSNMSFSVQCDKTGLEFSPSTLNSLFIQRRNLLRPSFYRMVWDVFRFKRDSEELLKTDDYKLTLDAYLTQKGYSRRFVEHFIMPMGGAIWSADPVKFNEFPARYFAQFFKNHGFLNIKNQPQWLTIKGGSKQYVHPITRPYRDKIRLNCPITSVRRYADHVEVTPKTGDTDRYDQVVIATHSDQALAILPDASDAERNILGVIPYQENQAVLHSDESVLPSKQAAWASWNYHIPNKELGRVAVTYDMNILQSLEAPVEFCVSLNLPEAVDASKVYQKMVYHHPVYNPESLTARLHHSEINGVNRTYFCGAYWGYGFHEDGVNSALEVCKHFGKTL
ncbi:MAG: FAD-dependent oxidoreductase [Deltaproteobacteria bacterium]|nr:MAG: FAD-dependent oxidoreductase [Deltaproteobacteria bacterium]